MAKPYDTEVCQKLAAIVHEQDLLRPPRVTRYEPGTMLHLDLVGVHPRWEAGVWFELERYVGGGFAGQVYRARVTAIEAESTEGLPIEVGGTYAIKIFVPWSGFGKRFRNALYGLGFQAPFQLQANPAAVRSAALWQKVIRRASAEKLGSEASIVDVHATFFDPGLASCGEVLEWIDGRVWRLEVNDRLLAKDGSPDGGDAADEPETEIEAKKRFMAKVVDLFHAVGAHEFARQYEWWTMKSQPNVLKRRGRDEDPSAGLVAVDFGAGLALLPFLPMSPGDLKLIREGWRRGRRVQFDAGDLDQLDRFVADHPDLFRGFEDALSELREAEVTYRESQPDILNRGFAWFKDKRLRASARNAFLLSYRRRGILDDAMADWLAARPLRAWLFVAMGLVPLVGRLLQRVRGNALYREHVVHALTSWDYFGRAVRARQAEQLIDWHRQGRASAERTERLMARPAVYWMQVMTVAFLPPGMHRFLTDWAFARDLVRGIVLRPVRLYFDAEFRRQWLLDMIDEGEQEGMLRPEEADRIAEQVDEPYIQKYLKALAVHVCTLPVTQIVSVAVAAYAFFFIAETWAEAWAYALAILAAFQVTPISPGSFVRGSYVVYLMLRERNWYDYRLASAISFWKYIGYLGFPIQMVSSYPALARFMAARWATHAVRIIPVFGERGALAESTVFNLFFNVPISLRRRWRDWPRRDGYLARIGSLGVVGEWRGPTGTYAAFGTAAVLGAVYAVGAPWWAVFIAIFPLTAIGIFTAGGAEAFYGRKDPRAFVLDEVVGMVIASLAAWTPAFLEMVAPIVKASPSAWTAMTRGAWLRHLDLLPGDAYIWASLAIGFVWFRFFDIVKPPPLRRAERLPVGWGMMADDVLAGAYAYVATIVTIVVMNHYVT